MVGHKDVRATDFMEGLWKPKGCSDYLETVVLV